MSVDLGFDLTDTQPAATRPLAGVVVFVDVRSGHNGSENRSKAVARQLDDLGATVAKKITRDVTHVVYKDGHPGTLKLAKMYGARVVSVLWVDACITANDVVSESKYPSIVDENSEPVVLGKIKRIKSMQPKSFDEEEITRSAKKRKKGAKTCLKDITPQKNRLEPDQIAPVLKCKRVKSTMVLTSCHRSDQEMVYMVVRKLGGFSIQPMADASTTHVICGAVRRTYNILAGSVLGSWVLPMEWVICSLEAGTWLDEDKFDMIKEFPSAKLFREERVGRQPFLQSVGPIYVSSETKLSRDQLEFLLEQCGAKATNCLRSAKIVLGASITKHKEAISVSLEWLLDCITAHKVLPTSNYLISPDTES